MKPALVIIPTYNEKDNVEAISRAVCAASDQVEILFVDDHSPDGTGDLLDRLVQETADIHVLHRRDKQGLGRAYIAGFRWALERDYEFVFEMDSDFSHDPGEIPGFLEDIGSADLVLGSRYIDGIRIINWPLNRLFLSKFAATYVHFITGMPFTDPTGGYKCFRRSVLETINLEKIQSNGYSFQIELTHQAWMRGFHIVDRPIVFEERRSGHSKMNSSIVREALWRVWWVTMRWGFRRHPSTVHPQSVRSSET